MNPVEISFKWRELKKPITLDVIGLMYDLLMISYNLW